MKYLKEFSTVANYETYINGTHDLPNVSLTVDDNAVHYNPTIYTFFCKLTLNDNSVVELEGSGELTQAMISDYKSTCVSAEIGTLCTSIGDSAFVGCTSISSVIIPNSVTSIGTYALEWCNSLTSVTIGSGVTSIGDSAFQGCSGLTSITINNNNTVYDSRNNCNAIIETATNTLINGCKNTVIPSDITSIGSSAFANCSSLTSIDIPDSVTSIDGWAFSFSGLTSVTIGSGVTSISNSAFQYCSGLTSIVSNAMTAPTIQSDTFLKVKTGGTLTITSGATGYDTWMQTGDYYLGKYNWTKVEQ